jgi:hypothetical protein
MNIREQIARYLVNSEVTNEWGDADQILTLLGLTPAEIKALDQGGEIRVAMKDQVLPYFNKGELNFPKEHNCVKCVPKEAKP